MSSVSPSQAPAPGRADDGRSEVRRTWVDLLRADARIAQALDARLAREAGLSLAEFEMLLRLASAEGHRRRLGDLRSTLLSSASSVTRYADRLEARGWLRRERPADDRRAVLAVLEPAGSDALRSAAPDWAAELAALVAAPLAPRQVAPLRVALGRLLDAHAERLAHRFGRPRTTREAEGLTAAVAWLAGTAEGAPAPEVIETWLELVAAMAVTGDALDEVLRATAGLPATDFDVLAYLQRAGPRRMGELAAALSLPAATATRTAERFQRSGWAERVQDPSDRRIVLLALAEPGQDVLRRAEGPWEAALAEHVGGHLRVTDVRALAAAGRALNRPG